MKKSRFILIVLFTLICFQANAQTFAVKGGLNLAKMIERHEPYVYLFSNDTNSNDYGMNAGFHLGFSVDFQFNENLSFEPGMFLTTKGMKYEDENINGKIEVTANLYFIDIPLTIKASHEFRNRLIIFGVFGPYAGIGLGGKLKATAIYQGEEKTIEDDDEWGNDKDLDENNRLDMGLTFGAGIEINSFIFGLSYDLGLKDISAFQQFVTKSKSRVLKFTVGYRF